MTISTGYNSRLKKNAGRSIRFLYASCPHWDWKPSFFSHTNLNIESIT